jgi:D-alanyl-lipoteichoic acid acyltransferase DltB (MBOAT superfamily)
MLFSSSAFIVYFLPITLLGFLLFSATGLRRLVLAWLTLCSLIFYAWGAAENLPLLIGSMLFNYVVGGQLRKRPNRALLVFGICVNVGLLAYYKYAIWGVGVASSLFSADWAAPNIILPLAISFFTFKQIAYLVDAEDGEVTEHDFLNYCLFITFFPQLIAGPITHHREMLTQFDDPDHVCPRWDLMAIGATLFLVGLFKKVMIADPFGSYTSLVFEAARRAPLPLIEAWLGAVGYALQIYFDFSGYCDMAIGLGLMFGIQLPLNFNSPYKAKSIIEYWRRWHMTLTRFLTAYIYNPMTTALSRRRMARAEPIMSGGIMNPAAFAQLVAFPMMVTMLVAGVWHGAGWQFVIFGLLHGFYLVTAHAWRRYKKARGLPLDDAGKVRVACSVLLTFVCVTIALVFFRAADVSSAMNVVSGMAGLNGVKPPPEIAAYLGTIIAIFLFVVWAFPNLYEWLGAYPTAFDFKVRDREPTGRWTWLIVWQPRVVTGLILGVIGALTLLRSFSGAPAEFIYSQF